MHSDLKIVVCTSEYWINGQDIEINRPGIVNKIEISNRYKQYGVVNLLDDVNEISMSLGDFIISDKIKFHETYILDDNTRSSIIEKVAEKFKCDKDDLVVDVKFDDITKSLMSRLNRGINILLNFDIVTRDVKTKKRLHKCSLYIYLYKSNQEMKKGVKNGKSRNKT